MSPCVEEAVYPPAFIWRTSEILSYGNFLMVWRVDTASMSAELLIIFAKFKKKKNSAEQLEPNSCGGKCQCSNGFSVSMGSLSFSY